MNATPDHEHPTRDGCAVQRSTTGFRDGVWHALGDPYPSLGDAARATGTASDVATGAAGTNARTTLCGTVADVARKVGLFDPGGRTATCQQCVWWEAIRTDTIGGAVARLAGPPRRGLAVALAEAVLAAADNGGDGVDHPATVELLAAVSAHAGEALVAGDCVEDGCDHPGEDACPIAVVACRACSVISGGWAGEWEGRYSVEATVETPCSLLTTMAAHYRIGLELFDHVQLAGALAVAANAGGWVVTGRRILFLLLAVVAAAAAVLSFAALRDLALVCGFAAELAWLLPVVVDAGAAAGSLVWLGGAVSSTARRFARALALGLLTLSVAANALGHGLEAFRLAPAWWVVVIVSAIAPAVLGAVVHLAVLVGRPDQDDEAPIAYSLTREAYEADVLSEDGLSHLWDDAPPIALDENPDREPDRAAALIAAGVGRRRLSRELDISEYEARRLLERVRPTTPTDPQRPPSAPSLNGVPS